MKNIGTMSEELVGQNLKKHLNIYKTIFQKLIDESASFYK